MAEVLFPNTTKNPEFFEKKYPVRNLNSNQEVTRFAPSPTGYLHIGNFFSAFLGYHIAKSTNGVFYFRLEDTDSKREIKNAGDIAISVLNDYNITYDEGLFSGGVQKGEYGPYVQSKRVEIYKCYAKYLVSIGRAYPCFCDKNIDKNEIILKRETQLAEFNDIEEHDVCRNLTLKQIEENLKNKKAFAIRLKSLNKSNQKIIIEDVLKGKREVGANCKDVVLLKNDGIPPYAFAHAVDDHLMRTTLVIRGEEWFQSAPVHVEIFEALGFEKVKYAHTPVICKFGENGNKRKISKRLDAEADMRYYTAEGYPKTALLEYLMTLANANFEEWRLNYPNNEYTDFKFSIEKVSTSNPMFDFAKLNDISKNVIAKMSAEKVYNELLTWAEKFDVQFLDILKSDKNFIVDMLNIERENEKPRKDIYNWRMIKEYYYFMFNNFSYKEINFLKYESLTQKFICEIFYEYVDNFKDVVDKTTWFNEIKNMANKHNFCIDNKLFKQNPQNYKGNLSDYCAILRLCITGKNNSPDLYSICKVLGKNKLKEKANVLFLS